MTPDLWDTRYPDALDSPAALAAAIHHELREITFTPDDTLTAVRPVVLDPEVRRGLVAATRTLVELVGRVCWSMAEDPAELARLTRQRPHQVPLLNAAGAKHEVEYAAVMARPDAVLRDGKAVFMESNVGSAPGCVITSHFLLRAYRDLFGLERETGPGDHFGEPFEGRAVLYRDIADRLGLPAAAAVVGSLKEHKVSVRHFEAEVHYLRAHGVESEFLEPERFEGARPAYPVVLKHFLPEEWSDLGIPWRGLAGAHADAVFLSPDSAQSLSSKLVFAWLSAGTPAMTAEDRRFAAEHIPWTREVRPVEVSFDGAEANLVDLLLADRGEFVLKPLNSFSGNGVVVGRTTDPDAWRAAVAAAVEGGDHVVQRYVRADPLEMDFHDRRTGRLVRHRVDYVLGPYVVDGVGAGCSLRHVPADGPAGVVNHALGASLNFVY